VIHRTLAICTCAVALALAMPAGAKEQTGSVLIRAGKSDSLNHALAVQFAATVANAVNGAYTLDVQESQGSIENVMDAAKAPADYLFTAGPSVIAEARRGQKPFAPDRRYRDIRALLPIPPQTVHWVVRQDSGITSLAGLAGQNFITGAKGSVSERVTGEVLQAIGIEHAVQIMDIDTAAAPAALKAKQVSGFAIAGPYPLPALIELADATPIRLLSLPARQMRKVLAADDSIAAEVVPKSAYPRLEADVTALALPAGIYTTTRMSEATAYAITKAFWSQRTALVQRNPPWQAVNAATLATLGVRLHQGALRYYREARMPVPPTLR
jgi:TRAP transporter TAXI family solute receptor